ncbi:isocitrate lyase/phosphoenolpyruvate mutase family protein [Roseateles asaccharophilus]|uniref:2-methylisocitrate lyase-like PEP mutase family enzyme n=1 Tax=Roseateles asaccharophilus TaxID=582607 RepID=A0ABU2A836_9BURK|nr:isocitrate lyase/phosphoenolpyruvate mutase family protein [Roseateles asaccharophilus]MDR7333185.1 2-methylisocitrate lyase-like PEP mutase family enzyme [Roseateles asaccharophilus]
MNFRQLHQGPDLLKIANVWDAGSAALVQSLDVQALATTSAGLAWALGYADGNHLPIAEHAAAIRRIARVARVPLSVDSEAGYSDDPAAVAANVMQLVDAGAVGINLEDGAGAPALLCRKIEAIKAAAAHAGVDVFINARCDVWLRNLAPGRAVDEVLLRARDYAAAGADGLFAAGVTAPADIQALVQGQPLPLNVMARPTLPGLAELRQLGVRRLSAGSAIAEAAWGRAARAAAGFLAAGGGAELFDGATPYPQINGALAAVAQY